jgi:hypothetical protein
MEQPDWAPEGHIGTFDQDPLAPDAPQRCKGIGRRDAPAIDNPIGCLFAIGRAAGLDAEGNRLFREKPHGGRWLDVAFIGIKERFAEAAAQGWFEVGKLLRLKVPIVVRNPREPLKIGTIARMGDHEGTGKDCAGIMLFPKAQRGDAQVACDFMSRLSFAKGGQHGTRKAACGRARGNAGRVPKNHLVTAHSQHKGLPEADDARSEHMNFRHAGDLMQMHEKSKQAAMGAQSPSSGEKEGEIAGNTIRKPAVLARLLAVIDAGICRIAASMFCFCSIRRQPLCQAPLRR